MGQGRGEALSDRTDEAVAPWDKEVLDAQARESKRREIMRWRKHLRCLVGKPVKDITKARAAEIIASVARAAELRRLLGPSPRI